MNFDNLLNMKLHYTARIVLIILLVCNIFFTANIYQDSFNKINTSEAILESASIQDSNLSTFESGRTQFQKNVKIIPFEVVEKITLLTKYSNSIKKPIQYYQVLSFQFFLSSQFSTST